MPSPLLTIISWVSLTAGFICAAIILHDMFMRGYRQKMAVMEWVWPITCLYTGPLGLYFYYRYGRLSSPRWKAEHGTKDYGRLISTAIGVSHCGAGCTLGDIIGATLVFILGLEIAGLALWPEYIVNFSLAFLLGIIFQYFSIAPMRGLGMKEGLTAAVKADTLSLLAFEIGVFGWMAIMQLVLFPVQHLHPDTAAYWFLMQIAMILGFVTSYPVNVWLIKRGIKEPM
jgi:hypothetical protein